MARAGHGRIDNCLVRPTQPADVISASPRTIRPWVAWLAVVVLLAVALIGVFVVALHYRQEAARLHRQLRPVPVHVSPRSPLMTISSDTVLLPVSGRLAGEVTVFAVRSDSRARVVVTARITGGRPDAQYELFGGDCAGNAADHAWAWGTTNSRGSADIGGKAWTVSPGHEYHLIVGPPGLYREHPGPALPGPFGP